MNGDATRRPTTRRALIAAAVVVGLVSGCAQATLIPAKTDTTGSLSTTAQQPTGAAAEGGTCSLRSLPVEAAKTVQLIETGGPFPYPRNDGVVFGNYERLLPKRARGYYHEYTVPTPGLSHRGTRRIITGGQPLNHPPQFFYTGDHYESFCLIGGI